MNFVYDADLTAIDAGVWLEFSGSKFLIAHMTNLKFQRALARLQQPHRKKIENGTLDPGVNKQIVCKALSEAIVLGWKDVIAKSGQPVEYSPEAAFTALMKNGEFRDFVSDSAMNLTNFREEEVEELGNG